MTLNDIFKWYGDSRRTGDPSGVRGQSSGSGLVAKLKIDSL